MLSKRHSRTRFDAGFEEFVVARSAVLLRTAYLLVGDRGHAEDLLQTALLQLAMKWPRAIDNPEAYTRRILVNLARDRWRKDKRRAVEQLEIGDAAGEQTDHSTSVIDRQAIQAALTSLSYRQREVIVLRFFADLSIAETAAAMRTTEGTVKSQTSRALAQLRQLLDHTLEPSHVH